MTNSKKQINNKSQFSKFETVLNFKFVFLYLFVFCFLLFGFSTKAHADYYAQGTLKSSNLLGGTEVSAINSFTMNSTIPVNTAVSIQFSQNGEDFYSSTGTAWGWDTLTTGIDTVDLSGLAWSEALFYKIKLETTDPLVTPVVGEVKVNYDGTEALELTGEEYPPIGYIVSEDLLFGTGEVLSHPTYFAYNVSFLPSRTEVAVQFSQDGVNWYSADGTAWGWTELVKGEFLDRETGLNLETLGWEGATSFYYKLKLTADDEGNWSPLVSDAGLLKPNEVVMGGIGTKGADPIGYWKFDEGYGGTAYDSSGNENHGTLTPGTLGTNTTTSAMWDKGGKYNSAVDFDGTDDYVDVGNIDYSSFNNQITISAWIKADGFHGNDFIVSSYSGGSGFYFDTYNGDFQWFLAGSEYTADTNFVTGEWYHLVGTYNNARVVLYVNGDEVLNEVEIDNFQAPGQTSIGSNSDGSNFFFDGLIDEVKILDYALTAEQVKTEYNGGVAMSLGGERATASNGGVTVTGDNAKYCVPGDTAVCTAPVLELDFDEKTGTTAYDKSGNGNDGTLTGGPSWVRGKYGSALDFRGQDSAADQIKISDATLFDVSDYTYSVWINPDDMSGWNCIMTDEGIDMYLGVYNNHYAIWGRCGGISDLGADTSPGWHFISWVVNGSNYYLYEDGILVATNTGVCSAGTNNSEINIGSRADRTYGFNGIIDDVKVYNYARTPAQIAWEYNRGKPMAEWRMDEDVSGDAQTLNDSSGNAKNATTVDGANNTGMDCTVDGKFSKACQLDGVDDYISVGDTGFNTHSLSFWAKQDYTDNYFLDLDGGTHTVTLSGGTVTATGFSSPTIYIDGINTTTLPDNAWHHITITTATAIDTSNLNIGKVGINYYQGSIDNLKLFSYPLTASQVKTDYNNGSAISFTNNSYQSTGSTLLSSWSCGDTVQDVEGNSYPTVEIGTQCWMAKNLNIGTRINGANNQTNNLTIEKYCYNDLESNCDTHGGLYQWNEAMQYTESSGVQGICPVGWHIPTDAEQYTLENYLATGVCDPNRTTFGCDPAGTALKSGGSSGFEALISGYRNTAGSFNSLSTYAYFLSSSQMSSTNAWWRRLYSPSTTVYRYNDNKENGYSVRCLKD